jgi:two-component system sensor histidine kinase UhpB
MAEPHSTTSLGRLQPVSTPAQRGLRRLSLDLHDGPMQDLAAVGFALERLRRDVSQLPEGSHELSLQVDGIRDQLSTIESALRELAGDQTDRVWETTLAQLVTEEVSRFEQLDDAVVTLEMEEPLETETDSQRIALQRVLREALTNVYKHARAGNVTVRLYEERDVVYLQVIDDGIGFTPEILRRGATNGLGLEGMYDRLQLLGSTLQIESTPGGPTTVTAAVRRWRPAA